MLTSQSFILYEQDHYSSQLLNYICLENEELSAANMNNKNKRKISETREESESPVKKKQASEKSEEKTEEKSTIPVEKKKKDRATGKCSTCKIHEVDSLATTGHKHVCPYRTCFCRKCIENARKKNKNATNIRISRTKKIFEQKQKEIESNRKQFGITLSEEMNSWSDIEKNLDKEKEDDYYDHQEFLKTLYSIIVQTNVIEQSSFAMRVIKTCFEILTAAVVDRIPKKAANKALILHSKIIHRIITRNMFYTYLCFFYYLFPP